MGKTGSGKTVLISDFIQQLIERGEKIIINDIKGDFITMFYREGIDHIFNPYDERCLKWNLFNDIDACDYPTERELITTNIASSIVPPSERDDFWLIGVRLLIKAIYDFVTQFAPITKDKKMRNNNIIYQLATLDFATIRKVVSQVNPKLEDVIPPEGESNAMSGQASGILGHFSEYLPVLRDLARIDGDFSIKKWVNGEIGGNIFITSMESVKEALKPSLSLFVNMLITEVLSLSDDSSRRIYLILDEFGALQKIPMIIDGLTLGRSKGLSILVAGQDLAKIEEIYGEHLTRTLVNSCNTKIILGLSDDKTAETFANLFGEHELYETRLSLNYQTTESQSEAVNITSYKTILPSEITNLKELHFFATIGDGKIYTGHGIIKNYPKTGVARFKPFGGNLLKILTEDERLKYSSPLYRQKQNKENFLKETEQGIEFDIEKAIPESVENIKKETEKSFEIANKFRKKTEVNYTMQMKTYEKLIKMTKKRTAEFLNEKIQKFQDLKKELGKI